MQKILILAALPDGLRLDREIREIEEAIKRAVKRDLFEIRIRTAVRPQDIRRALAEERPSIVHFCGHGMEDGNLVLEDDGGNHKPVSPEGLAFLFELHTDYVNCVLLNACYSAKPAEAISQHINYVIGMNQPIEDRAAIVFSQGFYDGLGYGNTDNQYVIQRAFKEGIAAIKIENFSQSSIPVLWGITQKKSKPIKDGDLISESGVDYTWLRDLLKAGQWKEADQETLFVMLKACGRKSDCFDPKSIDYFPCTDLRTIDQLWVKNSEGRFGFSVQKRIWERVAQDYNKFGDSVGWRTYENVVEKVNKWLGLKQETVMRIVPRWLNYEDLAWDSTTPSGYLPVLWTRGGLKNWGRVEEDWKLDVEGIWGHAALANMASQAMWVHSDAEARARSLFLRLDTCNWTLEESLSYP